MFGGKKKPVGKPQVTDVENLNFDDLVALGLIDEGLAVSIQDYIGKEEKAVTETPPIKPLSATPVAAAEVEEQLKVVTFPEKIQVSPEPPTTVGTETRQSQELPQTQVEPPRREIPPVAAPSHRAVSTEPPMRPSYSRHDHSELEEVLMDARRFAKREREQAQQEAAAIIAEAKEKAQLHEIEMQQRELILNKKYQREILVLKGKFRQLAEYFEAMQQNTQQLLDEYRQQTEELLAQLEELDN